MSDPRPERRGAPVTVSIYGVRLRTDLPLRNQIPGASGPPDVIFDWALDAAEEDETRGGSAREGDITVVTWPGGETVVRFAGIASHVVSDDRIECRVARAGYVYLVEIQLLGLVLALWLERRNRPALHASAVSFDGGTIAFVGGKEAGKTSMAAACMAAGCALVTEDLLALRLGPGVVEPAAGYPQMRMWPGEIRRFAGGLGELPVVHPAFTKRRVPVGSGGFGRFEPRPGGMAALYLLERRTDAPSPSIVTLRPVPAVIELIRHAFAAEFLPALGVEAGRLALVASIARLVPMFSVIVPDDVRQLAVTAAAVTAHARQQRPVVMAG